ncbi:hypothetical protein MKX01_028605 [Papaver californicum]|nr:hypothetical protein MKX01_028605 [Papaver californicum]
MAESTGYKNPIDGTPTTNGSNRANKRSVATSDNILRFLAFATTLVAVIVMAVGKQTKTVPITLLPNLPPISIEAHAKWQYMSAFVFFMVINISACVYSALSLILAIGNQFGSKGLDLAVIILDLIILSLLFTANGAAAAVGVLGYRGNTHTQWKKVCHIFDSYCHHAAASIILSLVASLMFVLLLALAASRLHKRCL